MKTPHKHAAVIKAWADGAIIQWKSSKGDYWSEGQVFEPLGWLPKLEYRVKPEVVKYKRYLWSQSNDYTESVLHVLTVIPAHEIAFSREKVNGFVRWIDTEWQEAEL